MHNLTVVMVGTRFPENVGMAARACANMGAGRLILARPERWDREKAAPLATAKGQPLLDALRVVPDLPAAVEGCALVLGTTARTGGWRRDLLSPEAAAQEILPLLQEGARAALVFGPEDRGLSNEETAHCQRLVTIPTAPDASSLNVAQSVLLLLWECARAVRAARAPASAAAPRRATAEDQERLFAVLRDTLLAVDYLHGDNPDYFLQPLRRFLGRAGLRRHEYDALMGVCRQVRNKLKLQG